MSQEPDDLETLAAEYALGSLDRVERRRAEDLMARDPDFAAQVHAWQCRLAPLSETVTPVPPPPEVWQGIEAALPPARAVRGTTDAIEPLRRRIALWRWCSLGATTVAAALVLYVVSGLWDSTLETRYVAVLQSDPADPAWLVDINIGERRITARPFGTTARTGGAYELWLIAEGENRPRSLGLLNPRNDLSLGLPANLGRTIPDGAALAVSFEPPGGSPTGLPTGPVVFQGVLHPVEP